MAGRPGWGRVAVRNLDQGVVSFQQSNGEEGEEERSEREEEMGVNWNTPTRLHGIKSRGPAIQSIQWRFQQYFPGCGVFSISIYSILPFHF